MNSCVFDKMTHSGHQPNAGLLWGVGEMQGWRPSMEDAYVAKGSLSEGRGDWADTGLFAVFDGHGGSAAAKFCAKRFPEAILAGQASQPPTVLHESFFHVDQMLAQVGKKMAESDSGHPDWCGCTAVACLVGRENIIVANAGDSRAVLGRSGRAYDLSEDHKPGNEKEVARIKKAGGYVSEKSCGPHTISRVNGTLGVSRAMGDLRFKKNKHISAEEQIVSCEPDINVCKRRGTDDFLVVACDGVWDVLSSQQVVTHVQKDLAAIRRGDLSPADVVSKILDQCLASDPDTCYGKGGDNMTMILVVFDGDGRPAHKPSGGLRHFLGDCVLGTADPALPSARPAGVASVKTPSPRTPNPKARAVQKAMQHPHGRPVLLGNLKNQHLPDLADASKRSPHGTDAASKADQGGRAELTNHICDKDPKGGKKDRFNATLLPSFHSGRNNR